MKIHCLRHVPFEDTTNINTPTKSAPDMITSRETPLGSILCWMRFAVDCRKLPIITHVLYWKNTDILPQLNFLVPAQLLIFFQSLTMPLELANSQMPSAICTAGTTRFLRM